MHFIKAVGRRPGFFAYTGDGVTSGVATPLGAPYGAIDFGAAMDGSDIGAMYTEDLS